MSGVTITAPNEVTVQENAPNEVTISTPGPAGVGVPAGGTTGQVLAKNSNTDYDTTWVTGGGGGGSGDVVGPSASVDNELPLYSGTTGKIIKRSNTLNGIPLLTSGAVTISNLDNTSDINKPVSTAQAAADAAVQAFAIQRANHTGTQAAGTITGLASVATSGNHTDLSNIGTNTHAQIDTHIASTANPHATTKAQVGLGNADDTSDLNKPISTATQTALDLKQPDIQFQDEGSNLGTSGTVDTVDFTGAGVTASRAGSKITVAISGGGGGGLTEDDAITYALIFG